jgi:hypothetical protein
MSGQGDLENQLLRFPSGVHDDIIDCEQILSKMFDFSKRKSKSIEGETEFEWWKNQIKKTRKINKKHYVLGNKGKLKSMIPFTESYR